MSTRLGNAIMGHCDVGIFAWIWFGTIIIKSSPISILKIFNGSTTYLICICAMLFSKLIRLKNTNSKYKIDLIYIYILISQHQKLILLLKRSVLQMNVLCVHIYVWLCSIPIQSHIGSILISFSITSKDDTSTIL